MFLSSLLIKCPPCPRKKNKEKQSNMGSSTKFTLHFEIGKTTRTTTRPQLKMFNIRAIEHKQNFIKT
jgi:hypothetical protein